MLPKRRFDGAEGTVERGVAHDALSGARREAASVRRDRTLNASLRRCVRDDVSHGEARGRD